MSAMFAAKKIENRGDQLTDLDHVTGLELPRPTTRKLNCAQHVFLNCHFNLCNKKIQMKSLIVDGIEVKFPFEPYPSQEIYIHKVVTSLKKEFDAVLESPTGTGKTLCLLTAVLSFRNSLENQPKVVYASRTHSQLAQVVRELKRLRQNGYKVNMSVMGGRNKTCIHPDVSRQMGLRATFFLFASTFRQRRPLFKRAKSKCSASNVQEYVFSEQVRL